VEAVETTPSLETRRRGRILGAMARRRHGFVLAALALSAGLGAGACRTVVVKDFERPLPPGSPALIEVSDREEWPDLSVDWHRPDEVLEALDRSIAWTASAHARGFFPIEGITHERALASLVRFREILSSAESPEEFERRLRREFTLYKSAGWDGRGGGVLYTAYCTPILDGRLEPDARFRFPLYGLPDDLVKGEHGVILGRRTPDGGLRPYPDRRTLEAGGLLAGRGLELVWLQSPLDAFIAHVNGSAFVRLADGSIARFGYAGTNGREYTSLSKQLVADGQLEAGRSSLAAIRAWAREHPGELEGYTNRNERYVFFTPIDGNPRGSLNVEVSAERTLATDKTLFPRGAVVFVETHIPGAGFTEGKEFHQFMLDQDTGGAIRTAGRADIYLGVGGRAEELAGATRVEGQLYYLFLRE